MQRDLVAIIMAVPLAVFGGLATLWITLEIQSEIPDEPLLTMTFASMSAFFFLAALVFSTLSAMELWSSE